MGLIRKNGKIVAFANLWCGAAKEELSIDLMRDSPDAPQGVMEYLFIQLMRWGKAKGYRWFNLGMVPCPHLRTMGWCPFSAANSLGRMFSGMESTFTIFPGTSPSTKKSLIPSGYPKYLACPGGMVVSVNPGQRGHLLFRVG